ncbi:MAG: excinuclease ABC subunit UvrC, partial [Planctomycetia bacterium]|nr:excinuclease ABC subunit UvrC [Planctomycetia bacterium]
MPASTPENPDSTPGDAAERLHSPEASPASRLSRLSAKARSLPRVPGVYLMKDAAGVVLYVGKASVLPNRVSTYFQASTDLGHRKSRMLEL